MRYSFDVFNLTNHPSFDIPIDNVDQNLAFSETPVAQPLRNEYDPDFGLGCGTAAATNGFYFCPTGLGQVVQDDRQLAADSDVAERAVLVLISAKRDGGGRCRPSLLFLPRKSAHVGP